MHIIIKRATCDDAAEILQYLKQIGAETDNLTFGAEGLPFTTEAEAAYISQIENSCDEIMFIAKENGKIVGEASLNRLPRRMKHRGDLSVSVLKKYWNKGIGSQLLHKIINFAKENSGSYYLTFKGEYRFYFEGETLMLEVKYSADQLDELQFKSESFSVNYNRKGEITALINIDEKGAKSTLTLNVE